MANTKKTSINWLSILLGITFIFIGVGLAVYRFLNNLHTYNYNISIIFSILFGLFCISQGRQGMSAKHLLTKQDISGFIPKSRYPKEALNISISIFLLGILAIAYIFINHFFFS